MLEESSWEMLELFTGRSVHDGYPRATMLRGYICTVHNNASFLPTRNTGTDASHKVFTSFMAHFVLICVDGKDRRCWFQASELFIFVPVLQKMLAKVDFPVPGNPMRTIYFGAPLLGERTDKVPEGTF